MSDLEFARLRVALPKPVKRKWRGAVFNSENAFEKDRKEVVVEVLPGWIRRALLKGDVGAAAGYLWTLKELAADDDPGISSEATLSIYRLGDVEGFARTKMSEWITKGWDYRTYDRSFGKSEYLDIRARALREAAYSNDRSFDELVFKVWQQERTTEGKTLESVDHGSYLEKRGRALPIEYWMERLDNPRGFTNALKVAHERGTPEVTAKLQAIFSQLHASPAFSPDAGRAASLASVLFRQTGDVIYRDYLIEQARTQLALRSFESSLQNVLEGLATTNDKTSIRAVAAAMEHENTIISEMAIAALGKTPDPAATEYLFLSALRKTREQKGFPSRELRALLTQNCPAGDADYQRMQRLLLSGRIGWAATTSDFDQLEFFRKNRLHMLD
ncbi:MAG TPA: HEAT repeat domain-containing protein [Chthoniobacterales bacterium]